MAKRRKGFFHDMPGLGSIANRSVNTTDLMAGLVIGFAGAAGGRYLAGQIDTRMKYSKDPSTGKYTVPKMEADGTTPKKGLPAWAFSASPAIGAAALGTAAYYGAKRMPKYAHKAEALLFGALSAGAGAAGWVFLTKKYTQFADVVRLDLRDYGLLLESRDVSGAGRGMHGLVVDSRSGSPRLNEFAQNPALAQLAGMGYAVDTSVSSQLAALRGLQR